MFWTGPRCWALWGLCSTRYLHRSYYNSPATSWSKSRRMQVIACTRGWISKNGSGKINDSVKGILSGIFYIWKLTCKNAAKISCLMRYSTRWFSWNWSWPVNTVKYSFNARSFWAPACSLLSAKIRAIFVVKALKIVFTLFGSAIKFKISFELSFFLYRSSNNMVIVCNISKQLDPLRFPFGTQIRTKCKVIKYDNGHITIYGAYLYCVRNSQLISVVKCFNTFLKDDLYIRLEQELISNKMITTGIN